MQVCWRRGSCQALFTGGLLLSALSCENATPGRPDGDHAPDGHREQDSSARPDTAADALRDAQSDVLPDVPPDVPAHVPMAHDVCSTTRALPEGWSEGNVGAPLGAAETELTDCTWWLTGGGILHDVARDDFHFVYRDGRPVTSIRLRIASMTVGESGSGQAGIVFREGTSPGDRYVYLLWDNEGGGFWIETSVRSVTDAAPNADYFESHAPPIWLRMDFDGEAYAFFVSDDGENWTQYGESYRFCECEEGPLHEQLVGLAATAQVTAVSVDDAVSTAELDHVTIVE